MKKADRAFGQLFGFIECQLQQLLYRMSLRHLKKLDVQFSGNFIVSLFRDIMNNGIEI